MSITDTQFFLQIYLFKQSWTAYDTPLSELELNPEISSELLRQVLARSDQMDEANQLVNVDFVDLPPTVKVSQLKWLVGLALNCESIEEFQSDWQEKYAEAHRQRLIDQKSEGRNEVESDVEANDNVTLAHFYGPKVKAKLSTVPTTDETGDQTDLVSLVKRRRIEAAEERQRQKATEKAEAERRRLEEIERIYEVIMSQRLSSSLTNNRMFAGNLSNCQEFSANNTIGSR